MSTTPKANAGPVPDEGQIVFVHGGVAMYRDGVFYTGMEDPRWTRPIKWEVTWWSPIDRPPDWRPLLGPEGGAE